MKMILGSPAPLFPSTGRFLCQGELMEWREGNLRFWNLYFTINGAGIVQLKDRQLRTEAGDLLLLPPGLERSYRVENAGAGWEFHWLHFSPAAALRRQLRWFDRRRVGQFRVEDPGLRLRLSALLEEMNEINLRRSGIARRARLMEALIEALLLRVAGEQDLPRGAVGAIDPRVSKAVESIHRNVADDHPLAELARSAGLSRSQFHLLFRAAMACSPQEYIEARRLELARFYLTTTALSVSEIARSVGYADPFYFTNRFRRRFALSPRGLRRRNNPAGTVAST